MGGQTFPSVPCVQLEQHRSIFDSEIVHHYPCLHVDYVRLSATPGSGVAMGTNSEMREKDMHRHSGTSELQLEE
jgi:hypothetical protein